MKIDFLVPGLLDSPSTKIIREFAPALARLMGRSSVLPVPGDSRESWLAAQFGESSGKLFPFAAIASHGELIPKNGDKYWLRADPVHFSVNRDRIVLLDASQLEISTAESTALVLALQGHFKSDALIFYAPHPQRWYISTNEPIEIRTHPVANVCGCNVADYWFHGPARAQWQTRLSEMQMLLHAHPVNEARETAGQLPINGVWLWGEGEMSSALPKRYVQIIADDVMLNGIAKTTSTKYLEASQFQWNELSASDAGTTLIALHQLESSAAYGEWDSWRIALAALEQSWFSPALAALRKRQIRVINLIAPSKNHSKAFAIFHTDLYKFWRRATFHD